MIKAKTLRAAFVASLPVMMGYLAMGLAAGVLLAGKIERPDITFWAFLTSAATISGALQFAIVDWISNRTPILDVALLTFFLNVRYAMYGLSLLERFRIMCRHYGVVSTLFNHLWFVVRAVIKK